jgi:hypothetical protein
MAKYALVDSLGVDEVVYLWFSHVESSHHGNGSHGRTTSGAAGGIMPEFSGTASTATGTKTNEHGNEPHPATTPPSSIECTCKMSKL